MGSKCAVDIEPGDVFVLETPGGGGWGSPGKINAIVVLTQVEKKCAHELANLSHCAVPFLSRAAVNLCWYDSTLIFYEIVLWIRTRYSDSTILRQALTLTAI